MAAEFFGVDLDTRELDRVLEDMGDDVDGRLRSVMSVVAEMLVTGVSDRYDSSGDGEWAPNALGTIRKKKSAKPMIDGGRLSGSTNPFFGSDFAEATTSVEYVKFHLEGGPIIPMRNPFDLSDDVLDEAEDFVLDQVMKALEG
ncbi:MAG: hypothetical protein V3W41_22005 [Planctomycetota bacterium]